MELSRDDVVYRPPTEVEIAGALVAENAAAIQAVIDVHEPDPLWAQADRERARRELAAIEVAAIPSWAGWTIEQALAWYDANIGDPLDTAPDVTPGNIVAVFNGLLPVLRAMASSDRARTRLVIAIRNELWPSLEE